MILQHCAYFVTGTDTNCGKTYITLKLMEMLKASGKKVLGKKPIAAGGKQTPHGFCNEDALLLQACSDFNPTYEDVNPFCFELPVSPHISAGAMGKSLNAKNVAVQCLNKNMDHYDHIFFEGAGGVHAPINDHETMLDVMCAFQLPVILVVGFRLGCLNHAILSYRALKDAGLQTYWIGNLLDNTMLCQAENKLTLERALGNPLIYI